MTRRKVQMISRGRETKPTLGLVQDLEQDLRHEVEDRAERLASVPSAQMLLSAQHGGLAARDVLMGLWSSGSPPREWWGTPLGRAVALGIADEHMTMYQAARVLGVGQQTVGRWVKSGRLAAHPDGGVTVTSHPDGGVTVTSVRALLLGQDDA